MSCTLFQSRLIVQGHIIDYVRQLKQTQCYSQLGLHVLLQNNSWYVCEHDIIIIQESSRRTSYEYTRRNSNQSNTKTNSSHSATRRTSSNSDVGDILSHNSSLGNSTPHVFINSEICNEVLLIEILNNTFVISNNDN